MSNVCIVLIPNKTGDEQGIHSIGTKVYSRSPEPLCKLFVRTLLMAYGLTFE